MQIPNQNARSDTAQRGASTRPKASARSILWGKGSVPVIAIAALLVVVIVGLLFTSLINKYKTSASIESANHLAEINYQIKLYIEEAIANNWRIAYSIAGSIEESTRSDDDALFYDFMTYQRDIWGVSDIIIYTESGFAVKSDGTVLPNDEASQVEYYAQTLGEYMAIVQSAVTYTIPIDGELRMHGSRVVALSVVQNLGSFLDGMSFSSFDGTAYTYLTQANGVVISRLTHEKSSSAYNFLSLIDGMQLDCLDADYADDPASMLTSDIPITYLLSQPSGSLYIVTTPISTKHEDMRLFYVVPESVVNLTTDQFTSYITRLSAVVIAVISAVVLVAFLSFYRVRKRQFDQALVSRDRMFNLLVHNTSTSFALLSTRQKEPLYLSTNAGSVVGASFTSLEKTDSGFRFLSHDGSDTDTLSQVNEQLQKWDGKGVFSSGFIPRAGVPTPGYYELRLHPVEDDEDEYIMIAQDVTQQYNREEAVRNALSMAERSNMAKERFLANMSHDIRTPMNAIVNMTEFAIDSIDDPPKVAEYLDTIQKSSDHLLRLINDILDMSRIESGQAVIEPEPFDLVLELNRIGDILRPLYTAKHQSMIEDFSSLKTTKIMGDRLKLAQILINLLNNAIKFTPEGGTIRFTATEGASLRDDIAVLRFIVADNGIGIPKNYLSSIFEPFTRAIDKRINSIEGTGLGLSICKSYVTAMGGAIACHSEEGEGATFTVELFFSKVDSVPTEQQKPTFAKTDKPFAGLRCILCEDNVINMTIARKILENTGFEVVAAVDGQEGVNLYLASKPGEYSVVYMDIQMPVMDGYQATRMIRSCEHPDAKSIPIIAMTANVFAEDVERSRLAGMNAHVGKPLNIRELVDITSQVLQK